MRQTLTALAVSSALTSLGTPADAARGGVTGTKEILMFVSDTGLSGVESDQFALCHLVKQRNAFAVIPLTYSVQSYALADFDCNTNSYIPLTTPQVATMRSEGMIPADIPDEPALPLRYTLYSYGVWAVILATLAGMLAKRIPIAGRRGRRSGRATAPFDMKLVEAMMLTASADGHLDERELRLMARAVSKITGTEVSADTVRQMASEATPPETAAEFHDFGVGLDDLQRIEVLRAALAIAVADGRVTAEERAFLDQLARGLMIPVTAIDNMLGQAGLSGASVPASTGRAPDPAPA